MSLPDKEGSTRKEGEKKRNPKHVEPKKKSCHQGCGEGQGKEEAADTRKRESRWPTLWIMTSMRPTLPPLRYALSHGFETREGAWNANDCREEEK